jgi:hypothetical protein
LNLLLCTGIDIGVHGKHIPSQGWLRIALTRKLEVRHLILMYARMKFFENLEKLLSMADP